MFVPNYRHRDDEINEIEGGGYRIKAMSDEVLRNGEFIKEVIGYYCIFSDGSCSQYEEVLDQTEYIRILITCPYCGSQIPQDEKVECECGWKAEAISITVFGKFVNDKRTCWRNPHGDEKAYVYTVDDKPTIIKCHYINKIHWLELSPGKENK